VKCAVAKNWLRPDLRRAWRGLPFSSQISAAACSIAFLSRVTIFAITLASDLPLYRPTALGSILHEDRTWSMVHQAFPKPKERKLQMG
jgi:hypothetical protein